jgi:hypothetical protein
LLDPSFEEENKNSKLGKESDYYMFMLNKHKDRFSRENFKDLETYMKDRGYPIQTLYFYLHLFKIKQLKPVYNK